MRRWIVLIVVALAVGAFTTFAVAWQAAYWPRYANFDLNFNRLDQPTEWISNPPGDWHTKDLVQSRLVAANRTMLRQYNGVVDSDSPDPATNYILLRDSYGWPMRCLYSEFTWQRPANHWGGKPTFIPWDTYRNGLKTNKQHPYNETFIVDSAIHLPLQVHAFGFIANTALYAALVTFFLLIHTLVIVCKRQQRTHNERCVSCGYTLEGLTTCPECSTPSNPEPAQ